MCYRLLLFVLPLFLCTCKPEKKAPNRFSNSVLATIADLQDKRSGDSLSHFLDHANEAYRSSSALAFASLQDSTYVYKLSRLLHTDRQIGVRKAAAYALGQTPSLGSETALLEAAYKEKEKPVLWEIIQAYGKVARSWGLNLTPTDTVMSGALAWSYYRMASRGRSDTSLNRKSAEFLEAASLTTRLAAAHYFARGAKDFGSVGATLITVALNDKSALIRMAAAQALGKITSDASLNAIMDIAVEDKDYRVRVNAVKSLQNFNFRQTRNALLASLDDPNINVGIAASEAIKNSITKDYLSELVSTARNNKHWRIQANLYEAVLSVLSQEEISDEIKKAYEKSTNPYQQAALLVALQHSPSSAGFLSKQLLTSTVPVIKSSAASALVAMNQHKNFDFLRSVEFANIYKEAIGDGDMAVIGIVCSALADSALNYRQVIKDIGFLKSARDKLTLPKDYESVAPLESAINYFEGNREVTRLSNDFNHPIDWSIAKRIPRDQKAILKTSKGDITIRLLVDEAPGSVVNFILLACDKYFDGKRIHRVVPNFVVQDGCPRGDGWGGEAYSIRSEFVPHPYATGSVGMASAGKDTEGTQWFITHSPTPHLEGRYTLFAEVENGIEVVHELEVGDTVISVEIINFNPV